MDPPRGSPIKRLRPARRAVPALVAALALVLAAGPAPCSGAGDEASEHGGREAFVPELAADPFRLDGGTRPFLHRIAFSPAVGRLGDRRLYAFRLAYAPNGWLAYEASLGHNPGESVHGLVHMLNVHLRHPFPGRFQPYATAGFGMVMVFPGEVLNADPVTENAFALGGGLEIYIRNDVAIRGEARRLAVLGGARFDDGSVVYDYAEATLGLSLYRTLGW